MEVKLVSVIIPVYNVEKYIFRCLSSLLSQTYTKIQILIVNDGTNDDSMKIVSAFAEQDKRIEIYNKKNGGLSDARNFALQYADGELICFVDSDDWVEKNHIEKLVNQFDNDSLVDIAIVDFDYAYSSKIEKRKYQLKNKILNSTKALKSLCIGKEITNHVWNKMYKRKLFENIRFEKGRNFEDIYIMHHLFSKAQRISCSAVTTYHYYMRNDSILHEKNPKNDMDIFIGYKNRYEFVEDKELKMIVLKFCALSCYKVLYCNDKYKFNMEDMNVANAFWKKHKEIPSIGLKYLIMYKIPNLYKMFFYKGKL